MEAMCKADPPLDLNDWWMASFPIGFYLNNNTITAMKNQKLVGNKPMDLLDVGALPTSFGLPAGGCDYVKQMFDAEKNRLAGKPTEKTPKDVLTLVQWKSLLKRSIHHPRHRIPPHIKSVSLVPSLGFLLPEDKFPEDVRTAMNGITVIVNNRAP